MDGEVMEDDCESDSFFCHSYTASAVLSTSSPSSSQHKPVMYSLEKILKGSEM